MADYTHCHHGGITGQCQECAEESMASLVCAKCGDEYLIILPPADDVFFKVQEELGKPVCPSCIKEVGEGA